MSIVMTVHSISHLGIEKEYKYFPFYSWRIKDKLTGRCPMMNNCPMMHRCPMKKI
jgi:hypothetical protein